MSDVERGRAIMRHLIDLVVREEWEAGAQDHFALLHFGVIDPHGMDNETNVNPVQQLHGCGEGKSSWFCSMYHQAPDPNSAAFTSWIERDAYADLASCQNYRLTFAWQVARSCAWRNEQRTSDGVLYEIDDTGAVVSPAGHQPETKLAVGSRFNGATIKQFAIERGPRRYMESPAWWPREGAKPKKGATEAPRVVQVVKLAPDIVAHIEYVAGSRPTEEHERLSASARDLTLPEQLALFAGAA